MSDTNHATSRPARWAGFLSLQILLIGAGGAWATLRIIDGVRERALPPLREQALKISPRYDMPLVVADEQLRRVLGRLAPREEGPQTKINHVDHALRFWGTAADFNDPRYLDGEAMRQLLTDHGRFVQRYGTKPLPLLIDEGTGVRVRVEGGATASSHVDHTMAGLAEVGTPLDYPVVTPGGAKTYRDMVQQALRDFSLNQVEYEWSVLTFALLLDSREWVTSEGQRMTFDRLARRLMREDVPNGVCFGNHRLFTLAAMLQVDEQEHILSPDCRRQVLDFLRGMTELLVRHQHPEGYWDGNWPHAPTSDAEVRTSGDMLSDRILATGHALEWWAIAPEELLPPRHVIVSAAQWLVKTIDGLSDEKIGSYYTFLSHAGRALALWRKKAPTEVAYELPAAPAAQPEAKSCAAGDTGGLTALLSPRASRATRLTPRRLFAAQSA